MHSNFFAATFANDFRRISAVINILPCSCQFHPHSIPATFIPHRLRRIPAVPIPMHTSDLESNIWFILLLLVSYWSRFFTLLSFDTQYVSIRHSSAVPLQARSSAVSQILWSIYKDLQNPVRNYYLSFSCSLLFHCTSIFGYSHLP